MSSRHPQSGMTLLEVSVTMVVMAIVVSLILSAYGTLFRGFRSHWTKAEDVQEMVVDKKRIDRVLASFVKVTECSPERIVGVERESRAKIELEIKDTILLLNGRKFVGRVRGGSFLLEDDEGANRLITWELLLSGSRWVGGAAVCSY